MRGAALRAATIAASPAGVPAYEQNGEKAMSGTGMVLVVIGVIVVVLGLLQHFAKVAILGGLAHGSLILIVIGLIVLIAGVLLGQSRRRPVV